MAHLPAQSCAGGCRHGFVRSPDHWLRSRWPKGRDWIAVAVLGILFFFDAYSYTTAARGALTLSTMPLMTLLVGATLGIERISARKTFGVLIAMAGVFLALMLGLSGAPAGAWRGETRGRQHYPRCKLMVAPCTSACPSCDLIVTDCLSPRVIKLRLAVNVGPLATT